jgi:hypothetical protein
VKISAEVGGVAFATDDPRLGSCLTLVSRHWRAVSRAMPPAGLAAHLESAGRPWPHAPAGKAPADGLITSFVHQGLPAFRAQGGSYCLVAAQDRAVFYAPQEPPPPVLTDLVAAVVYEMAAPGGLLALHAAGLNPGRGGLLILGPSGAGKSTLVYQALQAGAGYINDDIVFIRPANGVWRAFGSGKAIKIDPGLRKGDSLVARPQAALDGKLHLAPAEGHAQAHLRSLDVAGLVFLARERAAKPGWRRLTQTETLGCLLGQSFLALDQAAVQIQLAMVHDLAQLPARELTLSPVLRDEPSACLDLLNTLAQDMEQG